MKRFTATIILLVIIVASFLFIYSRFAILSENRFFAEKIRPLLRKSSVIRNILALRDDGDARSDYLGDKYSKILLEVDVVKSQEVDFETLKRLVKRISEVSGKETDYLLSEVDIEASASIDQHEAKEIL